MPGATWVRSYLRRVPGWNILVSAGVIQGSLDIGGADLLLQRRRDVGRVEDEQIDPSPQSREERGDEVGEDRLDRDLQSRRGPSECRLKTPARAVCSYLVLDTRPVSTQRRVRINVGREEYCRVGQHVSFRPSRAYLDAEFGHTCIVASDDGADETRDDARARPMLAVGRAGCAQQRR